MSSFNNFLKSVYLALPLTLREQIRFRFNTGYFPRHRCPVTFNEKTLHRKLNWSNPLFSKCADKIGAKIYVAGRHPDLVVLRNLAEGEQLSLDILRRTIAEHGEVVLKTNHDSGAPFFVNSTWSDEQLRSVCAAVNSRLKSKFGQLQCENWYSDITPKYLIESKIETGPGVQLCDYKFHVFSHGVDQDPTIILHVDFDRFTNHTRSFFDSELNWLPFSVRYPAIYTQVPRPLHFDRMLDIAKDLASPFSYARVDLYNVEGAIFFGEITFANESGRGRFSDKAYDEWLGNLWTENPCL
ncbi:ATP-grasp fold amidoligase family protein [Marinobacter sp. ATCH36]|uniref:ATP-grasp fold amidoligase family protein n=1 Tax=Marinobacter sp. ATCH36 TaxID=2945106 RepID=UPI00201FF012|nr:ATP-grasp fold amidoligase family protein [Marinobacter sp. ATCH36]MCL7945109.1 hypothetical protein [Marinobacter sp. ATCH36]